MPIFLIKKEQEEEQIHPFSLILPWMRRYTLLILIVVTASALLCSCTAKKKGSDTSQKPTIDTPAIKQHKADSTASNKQVKKPVTDSCFVVEPISDQLWEQIKAESKGQINRNDLRLVKVLHWDIDNKTHSGEMISNKIIANTLCDIFKKLYEARYPIQSIKPASAYSNDDEAQMQANNTSCYCYRPVKGTRTLSKHALGLAIDLNPLYNPYYRIRGNNIVDLQPSTATKYVDRSAEFNYKIDHNDLAYKLFTSHGFSWGGDWKSCKDFQHFEYRGK